MLDVDESRPFLTPYGRRKSRERQIRAHRVQFWLAHVDWLQEQVRLNPFNADCGELLREIRQYEIETGADYQMNVKEFYPVTLLRGQDLAKPILILITAVRIEKMRTGANKPEEPTLVAYFENVSSGKAVKIPTHKYFEGLGHGFSVRKTLAFKIAGLLGSDDTDTWVGKKLVLSATDSKAQGKPVKSIDARLPEAKQDNKKSTDHDPVADAAKKMGGTVKVDEPKAEQGALIPGSPLAQMHAN